MNSEFLITILPIAIPILFIAIGFYLIKEKGFNQTKVFLSVGALTGSVLGLILSFSFKLTFINGATITGAFIVFGLIVLSLFNLIIKKVQSAR